MNRPDALRLGVQRKNRWRPAPREAVRVSSAE